MSTFVGGDGSITQRSSCLYTTRAESERTSTNLAKRKGHREAPKETEKEERERGGERGKE